VFSWVRRTHLAALTSNRCWKEGGTAHEIFLRDYLRESNSELQTYYGSAVFTGRGSMPKILSSDAEVVAYVALTKGL